MTGEQKLAVAVINKAVGDFMSNALPKDLPDKLAAIREKVRAGEFLIERDRDPVKRLWFSLAQVHPTAPGRKVEWVRRLSELRHAETKVARQAALWRARDGRRQRESQVVDSLDPKA